MRRRLATLARGPLFALALLAMAWGGMALGYPGFASGYQTAALLSSNAAVGLTAVGMTCVILTGGIDLSVGALHALASIAAAVLLERAGWPLWGAVALVLCGAAGFGLAQGFFVTRLGLAPFLVTLVGMFFARGLALVLTEQKRISLAEHPAHQALRAVRPFGLPLPGWIVLAASLGAWWLLVRTRLGRTMHAAGSAPESARRMGLPVEKARLVAYTLSGLAAGIAGLVLALCVGTGDALAGNLLELDAIAAVVIGGTALAGGRGHVLGTLAGVLLLAIVTTFPAYQAGFDSAWVRVAVGALLLAFLLADRVLRRTA